MEKSADLPSKSRIPALDGLRGIAILLVMAYHYRPHEGFLAPVLDMGWCGVDLFFVLSGFLIGGILLDNFDSPTYYRTFYLRRAFRILPPYVLAVVALEPAIRHLGLPHTPWYTYAFLGDFGYTFGILWFGMVHIWSLAIEEQFYLLLPPIIRHNSNFLPALAVSALVLSPVIRLAEFNIFRDAWTVRYLPFGRFDGLLAGVLIAYLLRTNSALLKRMDRWLPIAMLLLLAAISAFCLMGWTNHDEPSATIGITFFTLFFGAIVAHISVRPDRWPWLSDPLLRHVGRNSYMVYLLHFPILRILLSRGISLPITVAASALTSFAVAEVSYRVLESRMIYVGRSFRYEPAIMACDR